MRSWACSTRSSAAAGPALLDPRLDPATFILAALVAALGVVALTLLAVAAGGEGTAVRLARARRAGRAARESGLDLALLALAVAGTWQLRSRGLGAIADGGPAPADLVLLAAPLVALAAGSLAAARLVPVAGAIFSRAGAAGRGITAPLVGAELTRRAARIGRPLVLLTASVAIAVLAGAYERTWAAAQRDQVGYQVPAVLRAGPVDGSKAASAGAAVSAAAAAAGATVRAVAHQTLAMTDGPDGMLLAVDPGVGGVAGPRAGRRGRADGVPGPFGGDGAPPRPLGPAGRRDGERHPGGEAARSVGPGLRVAAVVQEPSGALRRISANPSAGADGTQVATLALAREPAGGAGPRLVAVEVEVPASAAPRAGTIVLAAIEADGARSRSTGGRRRAGHSVRFRGRSPWRRRVPRRSRPGRRSPGRPRRWWRSARRASPALAGAPIPAVFSTALLARFGVGPGAVATLAEPAGAVRSVEVVASSDGVPTVAPTRPAAVVGLGTWSLVRYAADGVLVAPDEWWLDAGPGVASGIAGRLRAAGIPVRDRDAEVASRLADPVARGLAGALALAALVALLLAAIGLAVTAWIATAERRVEFAVARAVGVSRAQIALVLLAEQVVQLAGGILAGGLLGGILAFALLPAIPMTPDGSAAIPPVAVLLPWPTMAALVVAGAVAAVLAAAVLDRLRTSARDRRPAPGGGPVSGRPIGTGGIGARLAGLHLRADRGTRALVLVVVGVATLLLVGAPRWLDGRTDAVLRDLLAAGSPADRGLEFQSDARFEPGDPEPLGRIDGAGATLADALPASIAGSVTERQVVVDTQELLASGAPRAITKARLRIEPGIDARIRWVAGRAPTGATTTVEFPDRLGIGQKVLSGIEYEVAIAEETAATLRLGLGDRLTMAPDSARTGALAGALAVVVTGVFAPIDPADPCVVRRRGAPPPAGAAGLRGGPDLARGVPPRPGVVPGDRRFRREQPAPPPLLPDPLAVPRRHRPARRCRAAGRPRRSRPPPGGLPVPWLGDRRSPEPFHGDRRAAGTVRPRPRVGDGPPRDRRAGAAGGRRRAPGAGRGIARAPDGSNPNARAGAGRDRPPACRARPSASRSCSWSPGSPWERRRQCSSSPDR